MKKFYFFTLAISSLMCSYAQEDVTEKYIVNPSFEDGLTGWTYDGMQKQTNSYFTIKDGRTFAETWVSRGSKLGNHSIQQTLENVPSGKYQLTVASMHIQQATDNSTVNAGDPQTGACIFANEFSTPIDAMEDRTVNFIVIKPQTTIGMKAVDATGNWICVDNFRLVYVGELTDQDRLSVLQQEIDRIESEVLTQPMQSSVKNEMNALVEQAKAFVKNGGGLTGTTLEDKINQMIDELEACAAKCFESAAKYDKLVDRISHANNVLAWIADQPEKVAELQKAIDTANAALGNGDLTDQQIADAAADLYAAIRKADKEIYIPSWSLGDVTNPDNAWYMGRSIESKNWILFWEKEYGDDVPVNFYCGSNKVNAWETIEHAQTAFDFYTDSLQYINRATSKTNQYKMIIKLRYSETEWEATGSGVDDLIGLLTLTPWAQTSRNWQTLYHEVGHCFQYQTHCDNGDQNGWMYPIGNIGCAFWEQCAQWQAYKIMPDAQFSNEWFNGYLANVHKHILHEGPRYNNFFVMDYWTMLHGWDFMGRLWNESVRPEDAVEAYQRITDISNDEFNDEMWDCAARFATWDIPHLEPYHKDTWKKRPQPTMELDEENYWYIVPEMAMENTGHNIIQLNAPAQATKVSVIFQGLAGHERYRQAYKTKFGWRYGFVALLKDGTRVYGTPGYKATYNEPNDEVEFECPDNCDRLWLVVSGARTVYRQHAWDDNDNNDEQFGYRVMFDNTNLIGNADNHTGIASVSADAVVAPGVYNLMGVKVKDDADLTGLPAGIYIINGHKVLKR